MQVNTTYLGSPSARPLMMIHGWGMNADVLWPLAERLSSQFYICLLDLPGHGHSLPYHANEPLLDSWVNALIGAAPEPAAWLGWSLGGLLALGIAARKPQQATALVLLATTPSFISRENWPHGVNPKVLAEFRKAVITNPVRMLERFAALQVRGDEQAAQQLRALRKHLAANPLPDHRALADGLQILARTDLRSAWASLRQPALVVAGANDTLMPAVSCEAMRRLNPSSRITILPRAAHLPFLFDPDQLTNTVVHFLAKSREKYPTRNHVASLPIL